MGNKSGLCLFCGRWTELKGDDGLADCDRVDCISKRVYSDDLDFAAGIRWLPSDVLDNR